MIENTQFSKFLQFYSVFDDSCLVIEQITSFFRFLVFKESACDA